MVAFTMISMYTHITRYTAAPDGGSALGVRSRKAVPAAYVRRQRGRKTRGGVLPSTRVVCDTHRG